MIFALRRTGYPVACRQRLGDPRSEFGMGVDAGADRRAADRQLGEMGQHRFDPLDRQTDLSRPTADLLTEAHRRRVHQMRTAGFDDAQRFFGSAVEGRFGDGSSAGISCSAISR